MRDPEWIDTGLLALGMIASAREDVGGMQQLYAENLVLCRDAGDTGNSPMALQGLAATAALRQDRALSARLLGATHVATARCSRCIAGSDRRVRTAPPATNPRHACALAAACQKHLFVGGWGHAADQVRSPLLNGSFWTLDLPIASNYS